MCNTCSFRPLPPIGATALLKEAERRKQDREELVCEYCGKKMIRHIIQEGARFHVTSYHGSKNGALAHCSEQDCENNHGPGYCVPLESKTTTDVLGRRWVQTNEGDKFITENFR